MSFAHYQLPERSVIAAGLNGCLVHCSALIRQLAGHMAAKPLPPDFAFAFYSTFTFCLQQMTLT